MYFSFLIAIFLSSSAVIATLRQVSGDPSASSAAAITLPPSRSSSSITTDTSQTSFATFTLHSPGEDQPTPTISIDKPPASSSIYTPHLNTSATPEEIGFATPEQFKAQVLLGQNWYRAAHGAAAIVWNDTLADEGSDWAANCSKKHDLNGNLGQIFMYDKPSPVAFFINLIGLERQHYNWSKPGFDDTTKHFTQMVWKSTKVVGCAWNNCPQSSSPENLSPQGFIFLICQYYPKGNEGTSEDWSNNVGELQSGTMGIGVAIASNYGLPSPTSSRSTRTSSIGSSAATGIDNQSGSNKLGHSMFAAIASSAVVIGLVTLYPSVLIPLLLAFGSADAESQHVIAPSNSMTTGIYVPRSQPSVKSCSDDMISGHIQSYCTSQTSDAHAISSETGLSSPQRFDTLMIAGQNWYKSKLGAAPLVWNASLTHLSERAITPCPEIVDYSTERSVAYSKELNTGINGDSV